MSEKRPPAEGRRPWLLFPLAVGLPVLLLTLGILAFRLLFVHGIMWDLPLAVRLPDGGKLTFEVAPEPRWQILTWTTPEGRQRHFPQAAGGDADIEIRIRDDDRAVWIVEHDPDGEPVVTATLDFTTGENYVFGLGWWLGPQDFDPVHSTSQVWERGPDRPAPDWATETGGRPLARRLASPFYVLWRAPEVADKAGTTIKRVRRGTGWDYVLLIESTDPAFREGEWRRARGGYSIVTRACDGTPKVSAAIDENAAFFHDVAGIVWKIPKRAGEPAKRVSERPQPYPKWATPVGGEALTPWRAPMGPWEPDFDVAFPGGRLLFKIRRLSSQDEAKTLTWIKTEGKPDNFLVNATHAEGYNDVELRYRDDPPAFWLIDYSARGGPQPRAAREVDCGPPYLEPLPGEKWYPSWANLTDGRPLGRRLRLRLDGCAVYVNWGAPSAGGPPGTSVARAGPLGDRFKEQLVLNSSYQGYREGEWRAREDRGAVWMVEHPRGAEPKVNAAIDLSRWLFYDEQGAVWRIGKKPGEPMSEFKHARQPYPPWATVTGGKSLTPWRVPAPVAHAGG